MHKRWLHLVACFLVCVVGKAQQYSFISYTPKNGLVNSRVKSVCQDSRGRMIFCTSGGLSFYDGTHFENFTTQNGLSNNVVNDIYEIGSDSFLVATNTNTLNLLVNNKIRIYQLINGQCPVINQFLKSSNGKLYVAADEGLFELRNHQFFSIPLFPYSSEYKGIYISDIKEWNNFLILRTWQSSLKEKLILFNTVTKKVCDVFIRFAFSDLSINKITNEILLFTDKKVYFLDTSLLKQGQLQINLYKNAEKNNFGLFRQSAFDHENNEWLYTSNALMKISPNGTKQEINVSNGLNATNISGLFIDRENILWVITDGSGVIKFVNSNVSLQNSFSGNGNDFITSVKCSGDTTWLYESARKQMLCISKKGTLIYPIGNINEGSFFISGEAVYYNNNKNIFYLKNKNNRKSYQHPELIYSLNKFNSNAFGKGVIDKNGYLHITIWGQDSSFILTITPDKSFSLNTVSSPMDNIVCAGQHLWAITRKGDLLVFSINPDDTANYLHLLYNFRKDFTLAAPRSITADSNNNIWIGTRDNGLFRLQMNGLSIINVNHFTTQDGLTDNFIYSLACDNNNTIWAGTQNGLDKIKFTGNKLIIENISTSNNIFETISSVHISKDNSIWARCNQGNILKVENPGISTPEINPSFFITGINTNGVASAIKPPPASYHYRENSLTISVAAPSFIDEHGIKYSYWLEGSNDKDWSPPSNNSTFNFLNLSSGNYTLHLKASFPAEMYPDQEIIYSFQILPPWWKTWWFILVAIMALAGILIISIHTYYKRKFAKQRSISEKQQMIEKERTRIATDMHDDLGAGLSRIKFLSETIGIKKQQQEPIEDDIALIRDYSHEMIDKMGEIVWALNERNDTISDLLSFTRSYATEYLLENGIECKVDVPDVFPADFVTGEFRRNIFLTVKEALHNIVKHAQATRVSMSISIDSKLNIFIRDNGVGYDIQNTRPFSNGIMNMKKRMSDINGQIEIISSGGTTIHLIAPI